MFTSSRKIKILIAIFLLLITTGFRCKFITPAQKELLQPITLNWWGTDNDYFDFEEIIGSYRAIHPNITINYRRLREAEFERELIDALAEDRGPDIFSIPNTGLTQYLPKLEPLPPTTKMAYEVTQRSLGIKQETFIEVRENTSLTPRTLQNEYVDVVYKDVIKNGQIYGLPLSVDTLVLFYNRDLLNNAGIPLPPNNWLDLQENVKKLTFQNQNGELIQSGAALGTSSNIENVVDILTLLMTQNGAEMTDGRNVIFGFVPGNSVDKNYNPGPEAIKFYTDFANSAKEVYTWSDDFPNSIDAFAQGRVALMFGYSSDIEKLEAKRQGKLNYAITGMPQIEGRPEINHAKYQVQVVSNKSNNVNAAWDFIQFISRSDQVIKYLDKKNRPTALRGLVNEQLRDDDLQIFAQQILTAKNWYLGNNAGAMQNAIKEMIEAVRNGQGLAEAISTASFKISQTL